MTPVIFRDGVHSELSNLNLARTQIIGVTDFVDSYYYSVSFFQQFGYRRSLDIVLQICLCAFARFPVLPDYT